MRWSTRRAARAAILWATVLGGVAARAQVPVPPPTAPADTATEPVVVDIRFAKVASSTVQAFRVGDDALLPLSAFFDLAEIKHDVPRAGRLTATLQPGDKVFAADVGRGVASVGNSRVAAGARGLRSEGEEVYLSSAALAQLLGIAIRVDWAELSVNVDDPQTLPIAARLARAGERAARLREASDADARYAVDVTRSLSRPLLDGAVLDYSVALPSDKPLQKGSYAVQLGADLLGGALQSDLTSTNGLTGFGVHGVTSWSGTWRNSPVLKQARVGSTITTGLAPQAIMGATVTNAPYVRAAAFGVLEFPGQVGPHWEVEVYRDGLLVAVDSTDARGRFRVPLEVRYGTNLVKFVAYGPNGEERNFTSSFLLLDNLIPYRRFEYAASAGRCGGSACQSAGNLDLRYGILKTWTVRAGFDGFTREAGSSGLPLDTSSLATLDSLRRVRDTSSVVMALPVVPAMSARLSRAYASISGNPYNALNVTAGMTQHTSTNVALQYQPSSSLNVVASRTAYPVALTDALLGVQGVLSEERLSGYWRPFGERRSLYVDASDVVRHTVTESQSFIRTSVSFEKQFIRFSPFVLREMHTAVGFRQVSSGYGISAFVPPSPQLGSFFGRFSLRPAIESRGGHGIDHASLGFARTFGGLRVDGTVEQARVGGATLSLSMTSEFSRFRAGSSINLSSESRTSSQFVQGSMLLDRATHRPMFSKGPSLTRAGVSGQVFLDEDGDGEMGPGEQPLANVYVKVGSSGAQTDSMGRYSVWDIPAYEPVTVQLDTAAFANPIWTPTVATISVQPGPHRFEPVNFAVVVGGTVEGRVVRLAADGTMLIPIPGATVVFTDQRTHGQRSVDTFSDGTFNVTGIRPGTYVLRVDDATLAVLKGKAEPVSVTVAPSVGGSVVSNLELKVHIEAPQPGG